jgi:hypothetical protein
MAEWMEVDMGEIFDEESSSHATEGMNSQGGMGDALFPSTLSDSQEKLLSVLFVVSAALSILGSSTIVIKVLRNRSKASPYDRLMLGLSSFDILASLTFAMWPFLLPRETSKRVWAVGTDWTCTFVGFLTQLSFAAMLYNAALSYYCLLAVRFGVKRKQMAHYERWMHFSAILFPLVTASLGAAFGVFRELEVGFGCWATNNYPVNCEGDDCKAHIWGYVLGLVPTGFAFGSLLVNNIVIYRYVRRILPRSNNSGGRNASHRRSTLDGKHQDSVSTDTLSNLQIQEVAKQGFLYVGTFVFCYWSGFTIRLLEHLVDDVDDAKIFPLLLVQSMCLPLQGFFNMLVYNRGNYRRLRAAYPSLSHWAVLRRACFDTDIPRLADLTPTVDEVLDLEADGASRSSSATCGGGSFFEQQPEEYYNACAQSVLSSSGRSCTSTHSLTFSTTLSVVEEDETEEQKSGAIMGSQEHEEKEQEECSTPTPSNSHRQDTTVGGVEEETKEPFPGDTVSEGPSAHPVLSRSFRRIRMDGVVEDDATISSSCNGEEKQPDSPNNNKC